MHKLQMYENLMDMLEREVKEISNKGNLDPQSLDILYKIMMSIKAADKHMETLEGQGMSQDSYRSYDGNSRRGSSEGAYARRGRDGDGDGRYSEDSFRYSQDRAGSYADGTSYGYSRNASKQKMVQKLATLMDDTMSEKERQAIQKCMTEIEK